MSDRETIIKDFEYAVNKARGDYYDYVDLTVEDADKILKLLKEQKPEKVNSEIKRELVRCEKCIYGDAFDCPAPLPTGYLCQKEHGQHTGEWFCADGERG